MKTKLILSVMLALFFIISIVSAYTGSEVASDFKNGRLFGTPFPFNENNEDVAEFIAADSNGDSVVTGQEICVAHGMQCVYTQRVAYNFNSNKGNIGELAGPTTGCYGGDDYNYYYLGGEMENQGFVAKCIQNNQLASEFREGSTLFISSLDNEADKNGDGVTTGAEACDFVGEFCVYSQRLARNVKFGNGNIEVGGSIIGCYGGDNYEDSQSDTLIKCVKNSDLSKVFIDGRMLSTPFPFNENSEDVMEFIKADKNGDGVTTGEEFCNYYDMTCAFTQRLIWNFDFGEGFMEAAEPTINCYGGENHDYYYPGGELEDRGAAIRCLSKETVKECIDSDGGKDYYEKGFVEYKVSGGTARNDDECESETVLDELYCENGFGEHQIYECPYGCEDGACVKEPIIEDTMDSCLDDPSNYWDQKTNKCYPGYSKDSLKDLCLDPDDGKNIYEYAHTFGFRSYSSAEDPERDLRIRTGRADGCMSETKLREHFCTEEGYISFYDTECEFECVSGKCVGTIEEIESEEPVEIPENDFETKTIYKCSGCELDKKCYPLGYRKSDKFCSENKKFINQLEADSICDNNFECESNLCIDGECLSSGLWQRFLSWLKRLFG